jgi:hypothetical protein
MTRRNIRYKAEHTIYYRPTISVDDDVYLDKLQKRGVIRSILYM